MLYAYVVVLKFHRRIKYGDEKMFGKNIRKIGIHTKVMRIRNKKDIKNFMEDEQEGH